eukprot:9436677-Alexandrium_andersonii.AAC.1
MGPRAHALVAAGGVGVRADALARDVAPLGRRTLRATPRDRAERARREEAVSYTHLRAHETSAHL